MLLHIHDLRAHNDQLTSNVNFVKTIFDNVLLHIHISRAHNDKLNLFNAETVHNPMGVSGFAIPDEALTFGPHMSGGNIILLFQ